MYVLVGNTLVLKVKLDVHKFLLARTPPRLMLKSVTSSYQLMTNGLLKL